MDNPGSLNNKEDESHFYKGLFFGLLIGVGLVWFLESETGKEFIGRARKRIDKALTIEPGMEEYEEESTSAVPESGSTPTTFSPSRRFFRKSE